MKRDPIVLVLLAAILLTGAATTALLLEERIERHEAVRQAMEMGEKLSRESKAMTDKYMKESQEILDKLDAKPSAANQQGSSMKELKCTGELPNRKCEWQ